MKPLPGAYVVKPFTKGWKNKKTWHDIGTDQGLAMSPWAAAEVIKTSVDLTVCNFVGVILRPRELPPARVVEALKPTSGTCRYQQVISPAHPIAKASARTSHRVFNQWRLL